MKKKETRATPKFTKDDLVDTPFGRLVVKSWVWNGFTWMYDFTNRDNLSLGEEYLKRVPMKVVTADVYFEIRYSHLVEVKVPVDTVDIVIEKLAIAQCEEEMSPYFETAIEGSSGCYVHESFTPKAVDVQDVEYLSDPAQPVSIN